MGDSRFGRYFAGAMVALALALPAADSDAVVYTSTFDPPNFNGTASFDVAPACLASDGFKTNGVGGCTVTWLTATVTFTDAPGLTFDYSHVLSDPGIVSQIFVSGGDLAGVISGALGPRVISGSSNPEFNGPWWIQYSFDDPGLSDPGFESALDGPPSSGAFGLGVVYLYGGTCQFEPEFFCTRNENEFERAEVDTFQRVPEPGSLALALMAAAGAWCARRRGSGVA